MAGGTDDDVTWLVTCSPDGMTYVAPGLAEALGYEASELEGRSLIDPELIHPDDLDEAVARVEGLATNQEWLMRMRRSHGEGWLSLLWSASRWSPLEPKLTMMTCSPA